MAIAKSMLGRLRGKLGNLSCYEGQDGQTIVRSSSVHRRTSNMEQQRQETEFGTLSKVAAILGYVLKTGFPKGKGVVAGSKGFLQANLKGGAVVAEEVDPGREFVRKENAPRYFRGQVDYAKLQVAAGAVAVPEASVAEIGGGTEDGSRTAKAVRRVRFRSEGRTRVGYDCFPEDRVHGVALCPSKKMRSIVEWGCGARRGKTFDYGSNHNRREEACAKEHCRRLGIEQVTIPLGVIGQYFKSSLLEEAVAVPEGPYAAENMQSTVVPFRNGIMLSVAAGLAESRGLRKVLIANHDGDHVVYPDCREGFVAAMDRAVQEGTDGKVQVEAPYTRMSKADIARVGGRLGVDYARTYSCYKGGEKHCGRCATCLERREALREAGVEDGTEYER